MKVIFKYYLWLFVWVIGCGPSNEVYNLEKDLSNALRAKFKITTKEKASVFIEFWNSNEPTHFITDGSLYGLDHEITLLNLQPNTAYLYCFIIDNHDEQIRSDENIFTTASLPPSLPTVNLILDSGNVFNGYILIRNVQPPGQQILIDHLGKIAWYEEFDTTLFRPFSWTQEQTILALRSDKEIQEFDLTGNFILDLKFGEKGIDQSLHHEIIMDDHQNIISLTHNDQLFDLSAAGGTSSDTVKGDGILVLDSMGNKIWEWDIFDFIDPLKDKNILETRDDWSHANSIGITEDGHYLVSFRHFNQVWKINSKTGNIIWKLGLNGDFSMKDNQIFYLQHTAHINSFGEVMLFDNGGPERFTSRAISFQLDTVRYLVNTGRVDITLPKSLFSFKQGSAYLIDKDKVLICSSIKKSILITNMEGHFLWQLNLSESVYRADYVDAIDWGFSRTKE